MQLNKDIVAAIIVVTISILVADALSLPGFLGYLAGPLVAISLFLLYLKIINRKITATVLVIIGVVSFVFVISQVNWRWIDELGPLLGFLGILAGIVFGLFLRRFQRPAT